MKALQRFLGMMLCVGMISNLVHAQAVGDYGTTGTAVSWTNSTSSGTGWVVCTSAGTWTGATAATAQPNVSTVNVWIRIGCTATLSGSPRNMNNLVVEGGATLQTATNFGTARYIRIYGTSLVCDGTLGTASSVTDSSLYDGLGVENYNTTGTLTISGIGTFAPARIRTILLTTTTTTTTVLDMDARIMWDGSTHTGGTGIFPQVTSTPTTPPVFTINAGRTVTFVKKGGIGTSGTSGSPSSPVLGMILNVNGTMNLLEGAKISLVPGSGATGALTIGATGSVSLGGTFYFGDITYTNNGTFTYGASSTLSYCGTAAQSTGAELRSTMNRLVINNAAGVTLTSSVRVDTALTFTAGKIVTGTNVLTLGGSATVTGAGAGNFVEGTVAVQISAPGAATWPLGQGTDYFPVKVYSSAVTTPGTIAMSVYDTATTPIAGPKAASTPILKRFVRTVASAGPEFTVDSVALAYAASDLPAGTFAENLQVMRWNGYPWINMRINGIDSTNRILRVSGNTGPGDWVVTGPAGFFAPTAPLNFGVVLAGQSKTDTIVVTNSGKASLTIDSVKSTLADFTVASTGATISAGGTAKFAVTYAPLTSGAKSGRVVFFHSGINRLDSVGVSGGVLFEAKFSANPDSIDFGTIARNSSKVDSIFVTNSGNDVLTVDSVKSSATEFSVAPANMSIPAGATARFTVTYHPTSAGAKAAVLVFYSNSTTKPDTAWVKGDVLVTPGFVAIPASLNFGSVLKGQSKKDSLNVTNNGTAALAISTIVSSNADFVVSPTSANLAIDSTAKFYVTFTPSATGLRSSKIAFNQNGLTKDTVIVSGTGTQAAFSLTSSTLSVGGVLPGQTRKDSVVVTNSGSATLTIDSVRSNNTAFTITAPASAVIAPAATYKFYINFAPTSVGAKSGKIVFYHNGVSAKDTLSVDGNGVNQTLFVEDFTGAATTALIAAGWTQSGTTTTSPISIASGGLTFGGYPGSGVGNAAALLATGQDVYTSFPNINTGTVYLSFMLNVTSVGTGDYFIALSPASAQTNYYARLHVKSSGSGYVVGISKSNEVAGGAQYGSTVLSLNTTNLVVVKYAFVALTTAADTSNDVISVFVITSTVPATEPAAEIGSYTNSKLDASTLGYVTLRQGTTGAAPVLTIDGLRVGLTWASTAVTGLEEIAAGIPSTYELYNNYPNPFNPSTTIQYGLPHESRVTMKVYSLLGQEVSTLVNDVQSASYHRVTWNGRDYNGMQVSSGVYFFRIVAEPVKGDAQPFVQVKKMMLMK